MNLTKIRLEGVACYQMDSHTNDKPVSFLNNILTCLNGMFRIM
jgi:hypothetical protein